MSATSAGQPGAEPGASPAAEPTSVVRAIWPLLLAAFVCTLPYPAANIFVGSLSADFGLPAAAIGAMRGVGGGAALIIGFLAAPLLDRLPRVLTVCLGLSLVVLAGLLPLVGHTVALAISFFAVGSAIAIVLPAVQAAGGDLFKGPAAGQAASMVNAVQALSNVLAGPILALPALVAGWHGVYLGIAIAAALAVAFVASRLSWQRPSGVRRTGYREAFSLVARAPGAVPMLATSTLRNCVIQAWLAFLAATLTDQFQASAQIVAVFWFAGAGCVFLFNVLTGRFLRDGEAVGWRSAERLLLASSIGTVVSAPLIYVAPTLGVAFAACVLFCITVGVSIATLVSVLMKRYADLRGPVMGLNASGQNVGVVFGTGVASIGLGLGGYVGLALTLVVVGLVSLGVLIYALRVLDASPHEPEPEPEPILA